MPTLLVGGLSNFVTGRGVYLCGLAAPTSRNAILGLLRLIIGGLDSGLVLTFLMFNSKSRDANL